MASAEDILNHHLESFGNGDLEGLLSDYTDSSILETADGQLKGLDQLHDAFKGLLDEFGKAPPTFDMIRLSVEGDHAYIVWKAQTADNDYHIATDTFVIKDGKIVYQTFSAHVTPR